MDKNLKVTKTKNLNHRILSATTVKALLLFLVLALVVTLTACGKSTSSIDGKDDAYVTVGDYTITKGELYDAMKSQGTQVFTNLVNEAIFANVEVTFADGNDAAKKLDDLVNTSLYGTTDQDVIADTYKSDANKLEMAIRQYVDALYLVDGSVDRDALTTYLNGTTENYHTNAVLKNQYLLSVKQHIFAQGKLDEELTTQKTDKSEDFYQALLTQFKANDFIKYDLDLFIVKFINEAEARQYLRYFGLVSDSNGNWYQIPTLPVDANGNALGNLATGVTALTAADLSGESLSADKQAIKDALTETLVDASSTYDNLYELFAAGNAIPNRYYTTFYSKFTSSRLANFTPLNNDQVKELFVGIQALLNDVAVSDVEVEKTYTYDDLTTEIGSTLRTYAYDKIKSLSNEEDEAKKPYSTLQNGTGTTRFLIYRFDDESLYASDYLTVTGKTELEVFTEKVANTELETSLRTEVAKSQLTTTYVTTKVTEYKKDLELDVYDTVLRLFYTQANADYSGTKKGHNSLVAKWKIGDISGELTANDFYKKLEAVYGVNVSLDLVITKALLDDANGYLSTLTKEQKDKFESDYDSILSNFAADAYSSSGYPASLGREAFLRLIFNADNKTDAINNGYLIPKLKELYGFDYEAHYGNKVFENLQELVQKQYDEYAGITVSHVLVYLDKNYDGTPEDPNEYFEENPTEQVEFETAVAELLDLINSQVLYKSDYVAGIQQIITEYNAMGRAELESSTVYADEKNQYIRFRKLGIGLKYEAISSQITNSSNFLNASSRLDDVFYDRAIKIYTEQYKNAVDFDVDKYPFPYVDATPADLSEIRSAFGYHIIVVGSTTGNSNVFASKPEAKLETIEDGTYTIKGKDGNTYNPINDSVEISVSQIRYYLETLRNADAEDNDGLPSEIQSAFTTFFNPVKTIYDNTYHQRALYFKFVESLGDIQFKTSNAADKLSNYNVIKEINNAQIFSYLISKDGSALDANYGNLYADWFEVLGQR